MQQQPGMQSQETPGGGPQQRLRMLAGHLPLLNSAVAAADMSAVPWCDMHRCKVSVH